MSPSEETGRRRYRFRPRIVALPRACELPDLLEALRRLRRLVTRPALLDSAGGVPRRVSLLAFDPLPAPPPRTLDELRTYVALLEPEPGDALPLSPGFFAGGFLGALAYELGDGLEPGLVLPPDPLGFPPIVGGLYTDYLLRDEERGATFLVLGENPGDDRPSVARRRADLLDALARPAAGGDVHPEGPLVRHVTSVEHRTRIEAARAYIARGEIYQANVTQRYSRKIVGHPVDLYRRLRERHPAPYAGYLEFDGGALLSASPELLLELSTDDRGRRATTRPIKGTAPRSADRREDRASAARLLASEKDLAELAMIVDLERNDLGRVARPGSVRVESFPRLESFATVHHLVADVSCRPAPGVDAIACLRSLFPGGSVTGAPKLRSMEVIAELEAEGRGLAYGSLLALDTRGQLSANLLIRTLLWQGDERRAEVHYRVGGGITWSSDARLEEEECGWKGQALARALGQEFPASSQPEL